MLEYLVRPYQSPRGGATIIPSTPARPTEKATLTWGAKATMPAAKGINVQTVCCKEANDELKRKTERVKIENPDDNENYVWVERAYQVELNKIEKNQCNEGWDQLSGVGLDVSGALAMFATEINSGTTAGNDQPNQCSVTWNLSNNTSAPAA